MHGTCQGKRVGLEKEIKELETTEHISSRKYVCFTYTSDKESGFYETGANKQKMVCY